MRDHGKPMKLSLSSTEAGLSSSSTSSSSARAMMDSTNTLSQSPISHDFAFSPTATSFSRKASNGFRSEDMGRNASTSSSNAPDYFASSNGAGTESPMTLSRSSSTTSDHPWASLFPEGAAGAATNMRRTEQSYNSTNMNTSSTLTNGMSASSSSSSGGAFRMPPAIQRMKSGGSHTSTSTHGSIVSASDMTRFHPIEPLELAQCLATTSASILVIDIRPSTSFAVARVRGSINLCAPSTLLKRSGVTVERIGEEMLSSEQDQQIFTRWKTGPQKDGIQPVKAEDGSRPIDQIVVLDTDTFNAGDAGKPSSGGGGPCLIGLLRKFDLAGYAGQLQWLVGGFNNFSSKIGASSKAGEIPSNMATLIDVSSLKQQQQQQQQQQTAQDGTSKGPVSSLKRSDSQRRSSAPPNQTHLSSSNTGQNRQSLVQPRGLPMEAFSLSSTTRRNSVGAERRGMQLSTSHPTFDVDGQSAAGESSGSACANPFFDNIRQNRELQHGITERIPLELPTLSQNEIEILPPFLQKLVLLEEKERTEVLAKNFFDIEKAEQRRLIATMQQLASESNLSGGNTKEKLIRRQSGSKDALQLSSMYSSVSAGHNCDNTSKETFPFSIAAALERGSENRYNNIWTYEHSRIRCADASEYLNGSYLEPARQHGCKRRYIATQAPLPSTFATFWSVVWQQNVRTICMVTREFESGRVQSHNYWNEAEYGGLKMKVLEEIKLDASGRPMTTKQTTQTSRQQDAQFFPKTDCEDANVEESAPSTIKRRFAVSKGSETREIVQLQFIAWPDFSIPDDALVILNYIQLANKEQHRAEMDLQRERQQVGPLVVHCSAGVGRTGTYIVIDSVLDVLRKARREKQQMEVKDVWDDSVAIQTSRRKATMEKDFKMLSPVNEKSEWLSMMSSTTPPPPSSLNQFRKKSLKRELSPSAMDVDSDNGLGSSPITHFGINGASRQQQQHSSPPPLRRGRSDEVEEAPILSLQSLAHKSSPPTSSNIPSSSSGMDTPSMAMDGMSIAWDSPQQMSTKPSQESIHKKINFVTMPPIDSSTTNQEEQSIDLIQQVVQTIREQRMSTVQTARQYVFAYRAIIEGILREGKMENRI